MNGLQHKINKTLFNKTITKMDAIMNTVDLIFLLVLLFYSNKYMN